MKKRVFLYISTLVFLIGCNNSKIQELKSPFKDDTYKRIGIESTYEISSSVNDAEYKLLNDAVLPTGKTDNYVTNYKVQDETRDLKYAYFGKEISEVFFNSLSSKHAESRKYSNDVTIENTKLNQTIQMASGDNNLYSDNNVYTFDNSYKTKQKENKYSSYLQTIKYKDKQRKEIDSDKTSVTTDSKQYDEKEKKTIFDLKPLQTILDLFFKTTEKYKFKLLGENALYGKTKNNEFVIKEAYSVFTKDFTTTLGKKYLVVDNYFYEGLLEDISFKTKSTEAELGFKEFRFYHELLILSEPIKGSDVPILYLEKPVLVWFNEVKMNFDYADAQEYTGKIPEPIKAC